MKIAVVYKSLLGSTKKYATWICEEFHADLFKFGSIDSQTLENYDIVVVASGTYASQMPLIGFLKNHWDILQNKRVVVVAVGMAPPDDPQSLASYELIPAEIQDEIYYFKLPGKLFVAGPGGKPSKEQLKEVFEKMRSLLEE